VGDHGDIELVNGPAGVLAASFANGAVTVFRVDIR
jgi:hypothetical protein